MLSIVCVFVAVLGAGLAIEADRARSRALARHKRDRSRWIEAVRLSSRKLDLCEADPERHKRRAERAESTAHMLCELIEKMARG